MKQSTATKKRKQLEDKLTKVFANEIKEIPAESVGMIVDDLVTAFESRFLALRRAQSNSEFITIIDEEVHIETQ